MFTFSEQDYKWCVECNGNIRKDAYYCRYCRKPVGSKLLSSKAPTNVSNSITAAAHWLPDFDELLAVMPDPLRNRIKDADDAVGQPQIWGVKAGIAPDEHRKNDRNSGICPPNPPRLSELGIVWDMLISLHAKQVALAPICAEPRLQLLELTTGEVVAEYELRSREIQGGTQCKHCAEYILGDDDRCRFCTGSENANPEPSEETRIPDIDRFDESLLRNILCWEMATRRIRDEELLSESLLMNYAITSSDVDNQILKLKQNPDMVPISRWRERMIQLGIIPSYYQDDYSVDFDCDFDYFCLQDISALIKSLYPSYSKDITKFINPQVALIVVDHALNRWQKNRHYNLKKQSLLSSKALVYSALKDNENYEKYRKESDDLLRDSLPEEYRGMMQVSDEDRIKSLLDNPNAGPEDRLRALEERQKELHKMQQERIERMNTLMPGFGDIFKGFGARTDKMAEIGKHSLKGQAALQNSNPDKACEEFEAAILLLGDDVYDITKRIGLLTNLAEAQFKRGDPETAEVTFQRALTDVKDVFEATSEITGMWSTHHKYACFLRDTGNHKKSEHHFQTATSSHADHITQYKDKNYLPADSPIENWRIKEDYALLLRAMGRDEEAEQMEIESRFLKKKNSSS